MIENARPDIARPIKNAAHGLISPELTTRHRIAEVDIARLVWMIEFEPRKLLTATIDVLESFSVSFGV